MKKPAVNSNLPQGIEGLIESLGKADSVVREIENEQITVYRDGARLKRNVKVSLKAGRNRILVLPLSEGIFQDSLEVSSEDAGIRISAASFNYARYEALPEETLREDKEKTEEEISRLTEEEKALDEEKSMLETLLKNTEGLKTREEIAGIAALYHEKGAEIRAEIRGKEKRLKELREHLEEVERKIAEGKTGIRNTGYAEILADAETDREVTLRLGMTDGAAGWTLNYVLRAEDGKDKAKVSLMAEVHQSTGEDWKDASLVFSSGNARSSLARPVFTPERIGEPVLQRTMLRASKAKMSMMVSEDTADYAMEEEATMAPACGSANFMALPQEAKAVENGNVIEFALDQRETVEDGARREILLSETELPAEQIYECYPKVSPAVWLSAKITETGKLPALDGSCRVFHNGAFAGSTWLSPEASEDGLTISLGTDEGIRVSRKDAGRTTEKGFLGSGRKNTYNYLLDVANMKKSAVDMILIDLLPVAAKETVKVDALELSGAEVAGKGTEEGKVTWKLHLEPGAKVQKKYSYRVTYKD